MPVNNYSVVRGRPVSGALLGTSDRAPYYHIEVEANGRRHDVDVNVQSQDGAAMLYRIVYHFQPPDTAALLALPPGMTRLISEPGGLALDYLRQRLITEGEMERLPRLTDGAHQLQGIITTLSLAATQDPGAVLYAFGAADSACRGVRDIHLNQGNPPGEYARENGTWQDGALLLHLPSQRLWIAVLLAFQGQKWVTDLRGDPAEVLEQEPPRAQLLAAAETPRQFARERPTLERPSARPTYKEEFQPLPPPTRPGKLRMDLAEILTPEQMGRIARGGRLVFHTVGDTGHGTGNRQVQQVVADHMERQFRAPNAAERPAFFYHLGDVVYYSGDEELYGPQFFEVYDYYPAPIVAIPGNHDGDVNPFVPDGPPSLSGFVKHFCAPQPVHPPAAMQAVRETMTQPNPYWTLTTPLLTIIGLYTNVSAHGALDDPSGTDRRQEEWFREELAAADPRKPVIVALHHPPYSLDKGRGASDVMRAVLDNAIAATGRVPDAVFSGHVHNYQRFTRQLDGRQLPYIVAGCGGFPVSYPMLSDFPTPTPTPTWPDVTLDSFQVTRKGFLRVTVTEQKLKGEFFVVPMPAEPAEGPSVLHDQFTLDLRQHRLVAGES